MRTNWSYEVDSIPPILTVAEFDVLGGSQLSATVEEKSAVLAAVSQAVRDYCGWHVCPNVECTLVTNGSGHIVNLPVMAVTDVSSVKVYGNEVADFEWSRAGLVKTCAILPESWRSVEVVFDSGYDQTSSLAQVVAQIAINNLVAAAGLREEHAGQVGATYNQTDSGVSGGVRLLASDRELLRPYKVI